MAFFGNAGQTSIDLPDIGIVGDGYDLASNSEDAAIFAAVNAGTTNVSAGTVVKYGSAPDQFLPLSAATDVNLLAGVLAFDYGLGTPEQTIADANGDPAILPQVAAPIRRKERVNVRVAAAVALGNGVHVSIDAATAGGVGRFTATSVAGKTLNFSAFCKWVVPAAAGGVAVVDIDFTNSELATAD